MTKEIIIRKSDGSIIELFISDKGNCFCPVCGSEAKNSQWRPYDEDGYGDFDICDCGFQFGYTNEGTFSIQKGWEEYRIFWLNENERMGFKWIGKRKQYLNYIKERRAKKEQQLLNIGIKV